MGWEGGGSGCSAVDYLQYSMVPRMVYRSAHMYCSIGDTDGGEFEELYRDDDRGGRMKMGFCGWRDAFLLDIESLVSEFAVCRVVLWDLVCLIGSFFAALCPRIQYMIWYSTALSNSPRTEGARAARVGCASLLTQLTPPLRLCACQSRWSEY